VTIRSIVVAAGVSMSTVSNDLSGRHEQIAVETRERVLSPIASLNYQPNHAARRLVTKRTATTRLIMSDLTNSLSPPIILGAESVCRNAEHGLLPVNTRDLEAERAAIETMSDKQVDGLLFSVSCARAPLRAQTH
jgi:LacI family transcriptional regulator